ncbi:DUF6858 family protein [Thioflavicoccus mobilis]|nr:hypothetical protein [Thioflavicoccus mobilis]
MKQSLRLEGFPVYAIEIGRDETPYRSVDEIAAYFRALIEAHEYACIVAEFDHVAHTRSLAGGQVADGIRAAKNLVFCFGLTLPDPLALATRPRSIGIAETDDGFVVTFIEAPMPVVNAAMEDWAKGLQGAE